MILNIFVLLIILFSNVSASTTQDPFQQKFSLSEEAHNYLEDALTYMEKGSVNRENLDWNFIKTEAYKKASNALTPKDTYEAIELAISLLKDNHSFFMTPEQFSFLENAGNDQAIDTIQLKSKLINNHIGYLLVPSCYPLSKDSLEKYALTLQQEIQTLDTHKLDKWIVDLRGNSGGNMWPMVLGLRPLINADTFGFFSDGSGEYSTWNFEGLSVKNGNFETCSLNQPSYQLNQSAPRIAILLDNQTASSGESTAIAFIGGDQTKVFGQKTGGYTTANEMFLLSDGAVIMLSTTYSADRLGRIYRDGITPDQITEIGDVTLDEAIQWLEENN